MQSYSLSVSLGSLVQKSIEKLATDWFPLFRESRSQVALEPEAPNMKIFHTSLLGPYLAIFNYNGGV